jgi:RimJ/RimL family protein N-acetyltransferase
MIETDRLILRGWRDADRSPLAAINANPVVMEYLGPPNDRATSDAAIDRMIALADAGQPFFMAVERKSDKSLLGFIGLKQITFHAPFGPGDEIGWRLAPQYWGAGYASEGAKAVLQYGFETLEYSKILSFTAVNNVRSRLAMKRIGMSRVENGDFDHPDLGGIVTLIGRGRVRTKRVD